MSANRQADISIKYDFEPLTKLNFQDWERHVNLYLLAIEDDPNIEMWKAYHWTRESAIEWDNLDPEGQGFVEPVDPINRNWQLAPNGNGQAAVAARKLRLAHNKTMKYIIKHLSREIFDLTKNNDKSVPKLLRFLRDRDNQNDDVDRDNMRGDFEAMRLNQHSDMESYVQAFKNKYMSMRKLGIGTVAEDRDVLYIFHKNLPKAWDVYKRTAVAAEKSLEDCFAYYIRISKQDSSLPGASVSRLRAGSSRTHQVNFAAGEEPREVCRRFVSGKTCKFGDRCKFEHPKTPGGGTTSGVKCSYCGKKGHKKRDCFKRRRDEKRAGTDERAMLRLRCLLRNSRQPLHCLSKLPQPYL